MKANIMTPTFDVFIVSSIGFRGTGARVHFLIGALQFDLVASRDFHAACSNT